MNIKKGTFLQSNFLPKKDPKSKKIKKMNFYLKIL